MKADIFSSQYPAREERKFFSLDRFSRMIMSSVAVGILFGGSVAAVESATQASGADSKPSLAYPSRPAWSCTVNPPAVPAQQLVKVNVKLVLDSPVDHPRDGLPVLFLGRSTAGGTSVSLGTFTRRQQGQQVLYSIAVAFNETAPTVIPLLIASGDTTRFVALPCSLIVGLPVQKRMDGSNKAAVWASAAQGIAGQALKKTISEKREGIGPKHSGNSESDWENTAIQVGTEVGAQAVKDMLSSKGQPASPSTMHEPKTQENEGIVSIASAPLYLPPQPKSTPGLALGAGIGGLVMMTGVVVAIVIRRKRRLSFLPANLCVAAAPEETQAKTGSVIQ